jgi:hypothetical protein
MNSLPKFIASISALIASLSFAWLALTITGMIPHRHVTVYHDGGVELSSSVGGLETTHSGSLDISHY